MTEKILLSLVITPAPSKNWEDCTGGCEEHFEHMKIVEQEVLETIRINAIFQLIHLSPMIHLGK